ncbi:MAG: glycerol-3-phosphate dehydrogenase/oxidase [Hymenobacteraceae bacterium]|nr:glycerol-3-phosphate dehydrogenase/oxidase [Hymenobacteraceae bacterium]
MVIGGGASGLGVALDALSRGLSVALFERHDFAKGTSSRSTKLLHGGVRYLAQGQLGLVVESLKERGLILKNAPHVSSIQAFIIPVYTYWNKVRYSLGLKVYDLLAGRLQIGRSRWLSGREVMGRLPTLQRSGLKGGVLYYDGQFDDARLALNVAQTCADMGGCVLNHMEMTGLAKDDSGFIKGVYVKDQLTQESYKVRAKAVVNATGVFADTILKMDQPGAKPSIVPSQGTHLVVDLSYLGGKDALMIPETADGRVLFGIPWHGKLLLGTTDTVVKAPVPEPKALDEEVDFILRTCARYLSNPPARKDVLSVFAGLRPLAAPRGKEKKTKEISRRHQIILSEGSRLLSLIGGKWTTFRKMGEDTVDALVKLHHLPAGKSVSANIRFHGYQQACDTSDHLSVYGSDAAGIHQLMAQQPELGRQLHPHFPHTCAEVVWMVRHEMALRVEDVLARRTGILFLNAKAALQMAPAVARIMRKELGQDENWERNEINAFNTLAERYLIN